jgi:inner membrane protein YidH
MLPKLTPESTECDRGHRQRFFEKISTEILEEQVTDAKPEGAADEGTEPDPRFTFANERTFLAWSRTALALVVAGLGVVQLLPPFPRVPWGRHVLGVPLIVFGAIVAVVAYGEWVKSQRAMRLGQPLPRSVMPRLLTVVITAIAIIASVVVLVSALR